MIKLKITDLSRGGFGMGKDENGKVVFVPYTAPGDWVEIKIIEDKKNYAHAEVISILEPSPIRQKAPCPVFTKCGGCDWQHLPYSLQWETKKKGVYQALSKKNISLPTHIDEIPATQIWEYRNRIQARGNDHAMGFFKLNSREIVSVEKCFIARPEINLVWDKTFQEGKNRLKKNSSSFFKVELEVQSNHQVTTAWETHHGSLGFRQIHDEQNEKLKMWVKNHIHQTGKLYDLFGGSGNLSFNLSSQMEEIHCVDLGAPKKIQPHQASHFYFHASDVRPWITREAQRKSHSLNSLQVNSNSNQTSAIIDPPRSGLNKECNDIADSLEKLKTKEIIFIGCDVDAWVRDLTVLLNRGWKIDKIMLIDLFPQTHHVESVGRLIWSP